MGSFIPPWVAVPLPVPVPPWVTEKCLPKKVTARTRVHSQSQSKNMTFKMPITFQVDNKLYIGFTLVLKPVILV